MINSKTKRRTLLAVSMVLLIAMSAISVSAYSTSASLSYTDKWVTSSALSGVKNVKIVSGSVTGKSDRSVYFSIEASKGGWHYDNKTLTRPGNNCAKISNKVKSTTNYRLELNPYGTKTIGSSAVGTLSAQ